MQLSLHSDYALRVLIYLGTHPDETISTQRISAAYGFSKNHLVRVVQTLSEHGYVQVTPGRLGGVRLARDPQDIRLGDVVHHSEPNLRLVECFDEKTNTCPITSACGLRAHLKRALDSFLAELNRHTLAELLAERRQTNRLQKLFQLGPIVPAPASNSGK